MDKYVQYIRHKVTARALVGALHLDRTIGFLDLALLLVALLTIFTPDVVFFFHIIFVLLTFGAFYWKFRAFTLRAAFWVTVTTAILIFKVLGGETQIAELVEIPLLTAMLVLVFAIARQRGKAKAALWRANEELEVRVQERTAELSRVNVELTREIELHKQTERTRKQLASVVEQTADIVIITNNDGLIEYVNPAFEKKLGYTKEEAIGQNPNILKSGQHSPKFYEKLWQTILSGQVYDEIFVNKKKNGSLYYEEKTITPIRDSQGEITHFVSTGKDITERQQAEKALRESEERYRQLVELSFEAITIHSKGKIVYLNKPGMELFGATRLEELIGKPVLEMVHPDYSDMVRARLRRLYAGKGAPLVEAKFIRLDGTTVDVEIASVGIVFQGNPAIQTVIRDITARKHAEAEREELLAAERRQRQLAETLGGVFLALTAQTSREAVLDEILLQVQRMVPYSAANIMLLKGKSLRMVRHQGYENFSSGHMIANLAQALADFPLDAEVVNSRQPIVIAETRQNPLWVTMPETDWVRSSVIVPICLHLDVIGLLRLDSDIPGKFSAEAVDSLLPLATAAAIALENARLYDSAQAELAERRLVEKELRQLAAKNQAILDVIPDLLFQFRRDGTVLGYKIPKGSSLQEFIGEVEISHHLSDFLPPDLVELLLHHIDETLKTKTTQILEYNLPLPHASRYFEIWLVTSGPAEVFAIVRDITERKSRATALEKERARIARDLHDSLGQSLGYLRLKLDGFTSQEVKLDPDKFHHDLIQMRDVANEAYEVVRNMVVAARSAASTSLATILLAQARSIGQRAHFKVHLTAEGQPYRLSPIVEQQIFYIFTEALNNVAKHADAHNVDIQLDWRENALTIAILDDGRGFEADFSPADGHFGLRIMQERAQEINGLLSVTSNLNGGTRLTIHMPLVPVA